MAGGITTAACALLAWTGAQAGFYVHSPLRCVLHWGAFLFFLAMTFLIVWLDLRYIRMMYALERRDVFRQTLGDEQFRKALLDAEKHTKD